DDTLVLARNVTLTEAIDHTDGETGLPPITSTMTIDGQGFTIARDSDAPSFRLFLVLNDPAFQLAGNLTLMNVTVMGGNGMNTSFIMEGGAILNRGGTVNLIESRLEGNLGSWWYNTAGILNAGGIVTVSKSVFEANLGDVIRNCDGGTTTITGTLFSKNVGGVVNCKESTVTIEESGFVDNLQHGYRSGGIENEGAMTINNTVFYRNQATALNAYYGRLTINASLFADNTSNVIQNSGFLTVTNSTFSGNAGTAILNQISPAGLPVEATIVHSTLYHNNQDEAADQGGLVSDGGEVTIQNTIIAENAGGDCLRLNAYALVGGDANLDSDGSCPSSNRLEGFDPELADHGGPTKTHALLEGSNAIGAGHLPACNPVDERGAPRTNVCDIGAFEFGSEPPEPTPAP
ncbi:MAG: hypothetical protein HY862_21795, partial [Chloroflexi bacterium]|nr:hypothetical protein [Chloroflexota bacterium]